MENNAITTKTVVDLDEKTTPADTDLFMAGDAGTATLKKFKWSSLLAAIKTKIASWTFQTLNTSDKTIPGALNELNNNTLNMYSFMTLRHTAFNITFGDSVGYMPIFINIGKTIMALNISTSEFDTSLGNEKGITKNVILDDKSVTLIQTIKETLSDGSVRFRVKFTLADADKDLPVSVFVLRRGQKVQSHFFI